jgi:hypothetical protein
VAGFDDEGNVICASLDTRQTTMRSNRECFDLETGQVVVVPVFPPACEGDWDFHFSNNTARDPHATIVQNQLLGVEIAYSSEGYNSIDGTDVATLSFTSDFVDVSFSQAAVLRTAGGNYFKVGPVSESPCDPLCVTFQWDRLVLP